MQTCIHTFIRRAKCQRAILHVALFDGLSLPLVVCRARLNSTLSHFWQLFRRFNGTTSSPHLPPRGTVTKWPSLRDALRRNFYRGRTVARFLGRESVPFDDLWNLAPGKLCTGNVSFSVFLVFSLWLATRHTVLNKRFWYSHTGHVIALFVIFIC